MTNEQNNTQDKKADFKRWYDHDPLMIEVLNLLKDYQTELHEQAEIFLENIEKQVSKEAIDKYYELVKPIDGGNRWYDKDPVISKTVELLRVVPANVQKNVAEMFLKTLKKKKEQNN